MQSNKVLGTRPSVNVAPCQDSRGKSSQLKEVESPLAQSLIVSHFLLSRNYRGRIQNMQIFCAVNKTITNKTITHPHVNPPVLDSRYRQELRVKLSRIRFV